MSAGFKSSHLHDPFAAEIHLGRRAVVEMMQNRSGASDAAIAEVEEHHVISSDLAGDEVG